MCVLFLLFQYVIETFNIHLSNSFILGYVPGLRARVWYEHVPSADNPADVLSRDAMTDAYVRAKVDCGEWIWREAIILDFAAPTDYRALWSNEIDMGV